MAAWEETRPLVLTNVENTLLRLLRDVAEYIDNSPVSEPLESQVSLPKELAEAKLVLRFTGGWVRDKLLMVPSHDIDVAINKMTGYQFGLKMKEYLEIPGNAEKYGLEGVASTDAQSNKAGVDGKSKVVGGLHKIEANPERSKHLETVTTKILGLDIDLVNLRKETYTEDSRNPQMEFGTPEEDALRRDATINAMFYNLNTLFVEDLTGQGFKDIQQKIIRTPLEPYQTFKDDPLRVLRLIRFASRLGYTIDSAAEESMGNSDIKEALKVKISRERVGIEVEKMLKGPDPHRALALIDRLELYETIFTDFEGKFVPETERLRPAYDTVRDICSATSQADADLGLGSHTEAVINEILIRSDDEKYLAWQLAALVPWADAPTLEPTKPGAKAPPPVASSVARAGIDATNKVCAVVTAAVNHMSDITNLKDRFCDRKRFPHRRVDGEDATARDTLGMAVRRWGATWRSQAMFALLCEVSAAGNESREDILESYSVFFSYLQSLDLLEAYAFKPLLDGKSLATALSAPTGPWMKNALDVVMAWQLRHPEKAASPSAKDEAIEEVKNSRVQGELKARLVAHVLSLTIRPLFAKTQHPAITSRGRAVTTAVLAKPYAANLEAEEVLRPWKTGDGAFALDLLRWALRNLDATLVELHWGLLIPPLLTIVDDTDPEYKAIGCEFVALLLAVTPPALLARTGLGEVIHDALMPALAYLPSLTPEPAAVVLANAAYPALLALIRVRFPTGEAVPAPPFATTSKAKPPPFRLHDPRTAALSALLRAGPLAALAHLAPTSNHPALTTALLTHLASIVREMGVRAVPHLQHVFPLLSSILTDPFGPAHPPGLLAAARALQA
ncbi:CCA tRNA nucleotidyltransferase, mitochondrial, partial [Cryomyces antarcticus]